MFFCVDQICVAHDRELMEEVDGWCDDKWVKCYADAEFFYRIARKGILSYPTGKYTTIKTVHPGAISQQALQGESAKVEHYA